MGAGHECGDRFGPHTAPWVSQKVEPFECRRESVTRAGCPHQQWAGMQSGLAGPVGLPTLLQRVRGLPAQPADCLLL